MAGSQKVFLRIVGLIGDSSDPDEMPDRVNVTGRGRLIPTIAVGAGDVAQGPDSLHEIRLIEPVPFDIVDGMLTYDAKPYVWLPVPTGEWMWRITFDQVRVGEQLRELRDFMFPLDAATPAQVADQGYPGINLAQYGIGAWEPGTVNLTAQAISQITIYLGRASNAAGDAEQSRQAVAAAKSQIDTTHDHIHQDVTHADTHALAAGAASQTSINKALEASTSAGVATTKANEAAQSRADALTFRNTAQGAATTATTKAGEATTAATTATQKAAQTQIDALTLARRVETGTKELGVTSDGKLYFLDQPVEQVPLRVDTSVGTRVFLGDTLIHSDTGLRRLSADDFMNGWSMLSIPYVYLRRVGNTVSFEIPELSLNGADATSDRVYKIPEGFRTIHGYNVIGIAVVGAGNSMIAVRTSIGDILLPARDRVAGFFTWQTSNPWPTSLPGTAV